MWTLLAEHILQSNFKAIARGISLVENEAPGYEVFLKQLPPNKQSMVIGITGPPGAGKSTIVDALIAQLVLENKKIGVLCVDPSSPFNRGALLGDRIRMSRWYNYPTIFIRSLASRGSLGGLHANIIEVLSVMQAAAFDFIIVETVGVGQSEVEIASLADTTVVVLVPEAGDDIQTMKAGLMEIADIFVVNKCDRPDARLFSNHLQQMIRPSLKSGVPAPIFSTTATTGEGIAKLLDGIKNTHKALTTHQKHSLLAEKAYTLIQKQRMKNIHKQTLINNIQHEAEAGDFNLFAYVETFSASS